MDNRWVMMEKESGARRREGDGDIKVNLLLACKTNICQQKKRAK